MASSASVYNRIGLIEEQKSLLQSIQLTSILDCLAQILHKHKAHASFGIALLHRHFDLPEGYAMVHSSDNAAIDKCEIERVGTRKIYPSSYYLDSDGFQPFEFSSASTPVPGTTLLTELAMVLRAYGLSRILGISHLCVTDELWTETLSIDGSGTTATRLPHCSETLKMEAITTEWFVSEKDGRIAMKACKQCVDTDAGHKRQ